MATPPRTVILAPHHDDAVISAWSVLTADADVTVVNVFAGVPPPGTLGRWDRRTGATDSADRMRARRAEDEAVLASVGRHAIHLDLLEDQYRDGPPDAGAVLAAVEPHVGGAVVYGPAGIGLHSDHLAARSLLATLHGRGADVRLYADLPYCVRHGWPAWVSGAAEPNPQADAQWAHALGGAELDVAALEPRAVRLDPAAAERKLRLLEGYRTQFAAMAMREPALSEPALFPFEAFWEPRVGSPR